MSIDTAKILYRLPVALMLAVLVNIVISCNGNPAIDSKLNNAEDVMNQYPDSALNILRGIDKERLKSKHERARYALLMSMALDKNYIDTTTFDVLQTAIDYYLDNGSADDKLRTWFYEGRIFQNRNDYDEAMQCFLKAADLKDYNDTLTFANMLIAQSNLYFQSYRIDDYISNNLKAAILFEKIGHNRYHMVGLIKALDGCVTLDYRVKADSLLLKVENLSESISEYQEIISSIKLMHKIKFGEKTDIKNLLDSISSLEACDDEFKLNMSLGYLKINEPQKAMRLFESIDSSSSIAHSIKYISIKPKILEANKQFEKALVALNHFFSTIETENERISYQKTTVAEERHELELENLYKLQRKDKQIWFGSGVVLVLVIIIGIIYYQLRIGKKNRIISEQNQSRLQLENDNLQKQNTVLELEKQAAELNTEKQKLASENMKLRISQLEGENEQLKELAKKEELPEDVRKVIKERIEKMNTLFAARILEKDADVTLYDDWVKQEISDKERFMDSNRLAFTASHPMFIKYLEDHGLTDYEINYLCLYAIGLKGKEVGNYMQLRRHYNISSDIRRKLGIDEHETNIGIYVRKLLKKL